MYPTKAYFWCISGAFHGSNNVIANIQDSVNYQLVPSFAAIIEIIETGSF